MKVFICENFGTILNVAGTILIALSFGAHPDKDTAPYTTDDKGRKKYIAYFNYPSLFWVGMILLGIGFLAQLKI